MCKGTAKGPQERRASKGQMTLDGMLCNRDCPHLNTALHWMGENRCNDVHNANPYVQAEHTEEHTLESSIIQGPFLCPTDPPRPRIIRIVGALSQHDLSVYIVRAASELPLSSLNLIQRPPGLRLGLWFDRLETPLGQLLGSQLGQQSL